MDINGTYDRLIAIGYYASFSPDGKKILFAQLERNSSDKSMGWNNSLRIVDKDGKNETIVMSTSYPNHILHSMFFQNGESVLFCLELMKIQYAGVPVSINENDIFTTGVWTIDINGNNPQHLADDGASTENPFTRAKISQNMETIIRYGNTPWATLSLWTMDSDGTNEVQIMKSEHLGSADISNDGTKVVWLWWYEIRDSNNDIDFQNQIWISNSDGSGMERLVRGLNPQFSSIGKIVIYEYDGKICSVEYN